MIGVRRLDRSADATSNASPTRRLPPWLARVFDAPSAPECVYLSATDDGSITGVLPLVLIRAHLRRFGVSLRSSITAGWSRLRDVAARSPPPRRDARDAAWRI